MNVLFVVISIVTAVLGVMLIAHSLKYKLFYIKPFVGVVIVWSFGLIMVALIEAQAAIGDIIIPGLITAALGTCVGFLMVADGLELPYCSFRGVLIEEVSRK